MTDPEAVVLLDQIAPVLNKLTQRSDAEPRYEMMSGALIWPDEVPDIDDLDGIRCLWAMRYIYHTRTQMILGSPIAEDRQQLWDEAQRLFPRWPGFAPERRSPVFADLYYEQKAKLDRDLDSFERRIDRSRLGSSPRA